MPARASQPPDGFAYTAFYCEENVWHLAQHPAVAALPRRVVFVSNPARVCPLWAQRAAPSHGEPVFWDYHVVLAARDPGAGWQVWDLDSRLGMPVPLADYLARTFEPPGRATASLPDELRPRFRVIDGDQYVGAFSSDRAHMRGSDGAYTHPPPPWPAIGAGRPSNLARLIDTRAESLGPVPPGGRAATATTTTTTTTTSPPTGALGQLFGDLGALRAHFAE